MDGPCEMLSFDKMLSQLDLELAMAEADKVEDDEDLWKKLLLMVSKHVIEREKGENGKYS